MSLGIIAGTGFSEGLSLGVALPVDSASVITPWGSPSAAPQMLSLATELAPLVFLPRHGAGHRLAPHLINYRANIALLAEQGVTRILAVNVVGGIAPHLPAGALLVPDQVIDYTHGRADTFYDGAVRFDGAATELRHMDFTHPFDVELREVLLNAAVSMQEPCYDGGVYACTQGPRLETAAEIQRLARDGADIVGMTAMPEAALARELNIAYASLCLVVNPAAGISDEPVTMAMIEGHLRAGRARLLRVLREAAVRLLSS